MLKLDFTAGFVQHQKVIPGWPCHYGMLRVNTVGDDVNVVVVIFVAVDGKKCLVIGHANCFEGLGSGYRSLVKGGLLACRP